MTRLQAFPQTQREAQQIHTIAFIVLHLGERLVDELGQEEFSIFLPRDLIDKYAGQGVALYLEEGDDGDTLVVKTYEPESPVIDGEAEEVE